MKRIMTIATTTIIIAMVVIACGRGRGRGRNGDPSFHNGDRYRDRNPSIPPQAPAPTPTPPQAPAPTPGEGTQFMILKSDLPDCEVKRVQLWTQKNSRSGGLLAKRKLVDVWDGNNLKITENHNGYLLSLPVDSDSTGNTTVVRAHATLYCYGGNSVWGGASNAQSYDWNIGDNSFRKSPFTLVQVFGKIYHKDVEAVLNELAPDYGQDRLVIGVSSSIPLYRDYPANSAESVSTISRYYGKYEYATGYGKGCARDQNKRHHQNMDSWMFQFGYAGYNGYIDGGGMIGSDSDVRYVISCVKLFNGKKSCSDVIFNKDYTGGASQPSKFEWGQENYPPWMR